MRSTITTAAALAAVFFVPDSSLARGLQVAQVEVIESSPIIRAIGQSRNGNTAAAQNGQDDQSLQAELYYQVQRLQEEVQALRGQVEEQTYEIQRLKQQRMDDYMDLDRRISELSQGGAAGNRGNGSPSNGSRGSNRDTATAAIPADEFASYSAAVDLATKQQEFDRAIVALNEHLAQYPDGRYAANAHYWLGQIYFVQGKMEEARQSFGQVVEDYPDHNKAPEARYKLGQVYFRLGDKTQAKALLEEVAAGGSDSAPLAKNFLRQNFSN
ncbi:tol-pal system protein YbgF [Gilvimarinus sp. F26214L]|uniref:tol-pal system protein YbgF n=1 Tax=Gilvimarinus sp. DZF01 TaxID=3461371 RepID=UPI0040462DF1